MIAEAVDNRLAEFSVDGSTCKICDKCWSLHGKAIPARPFAINLCVHPRISYFSSSPSVLGVEFGDLCLSCEAELSAILKSHIEGFFSEFEPDKLRRIMLQQQERINYLENRLNERNQ